VFTNPVRKTEYGGSCESQDEKALKELYNPKFQDWCRWRFKYVHRDILKYIDKHRNKTITSYNIRTFVNVTMQPHYNNNKR
jgi:hypothetical protein